VSRDKLPEPRWKMQWLSDGVEVERHTMNMPLYLYTPSGLSAVIEAYGRNKTMVQQDGRDAPFRAGRLSRYTSTTLGNSKYRSDLAR